MDYNIVVTADAEEDFDIFIQYLLYVKKNGQAASYLINDFEATKANLKNVAGSLKLCENPKLAAQGYRRINFMSHDYFFLYRVVGKDVFIDNMFHFLQDYENKMN